jgi:hypothetical protein
LGLGSKFYFRLKKWISDDWLKIKMKNKENNYFHLLLTA